MASNSTYKNQGITLEDAFQFIEVKEAVKRHLVDSQRLDATQSSYCCGKEEEIKTRKQDVKSLYCGKQGHGKAEPPPIRKAECPAFRN